MCGDFYFPQGEVYHLYPPLSTTIESEKIILIHPKCEKFVVLLNCPYFQYCNSNIGLFSIATCKIIAIYLLCFIFCICFLYFFSIFLFLSIVITIKLSLFHALKGDSRNIALWGKSLFCFLGAPIIFSSTLLP